MQDLRLILMVIGAIAIVVLLLHGLWISRKAPPSLFNDASSQHPKPEHNPPSMNDLDEGVGEVRVVACPPEYPARHHNSGVPINSSVAPSPIKTNDLLHNTPTTSHQHDLSPPPQSSAADRARHPSHSEPSAPPTATSQQEDKPQPASPQHTVKSQPISPPVVAAKKEEKPSETILVLHVSAHPGHVIAGKPLLHSILQSGLRFGEMDIFHRHLTPVANSPVLFSLANMVKPGSFNLDTMPDFSTPGVSLFMVIPSYGDANKNFDLMLQSAQRIANEVDGVVLDDKRHIITPQTLKMYHAQIRAALEANV